MGQSKVCRKNNHQGKSHLLLRLMMSIFMLLLLTCQGLSQDLDPRAYIWIPVNGNFVNAGFAFSHGGVLTDPTLPVENLKASIQTTNLGYGRSFGLFGKTAQVFAAVPYTWAQASADVNGQRESITRSGFSDMRLRASILLLGAPATSRANFAKVKRKTILGLSLNVVAPTGQYFSDKLINLGTHRWSFRPELALSHPMGKHWVIDVYTGLWLFTNNKEFYTGHTLRSQDPMGTIQGHMSYNINPKMWVAVDATFYYGGTSTIGGVIKDDRQSNSRIGATFVFPFLKKNSIKLAASTGAIVRAGADFNTISIGWQRSWFGKKKTS
jgi:Putative MetA-pathway of phenol degradation